MTPEDVLGLVRLEGTVMTDGVLTVGHMGPPMYSPGVVIADNQSWERGHFKTIFTMPGLQSLNPIGREHVFIEEKSLLTHHKVMPIKEFDFTKLDELLEYIQIHGALSLLITDRAASIAFAERCWYKLCAKFKHQQVGQYNLYKGYPGKLHCVVTLTSLKRGVPLFADPRKVRGCVLRVSAFGANSLKAGALFHMDMLLTDEAHGVLTIDGGYIWHPSPLSKGHIDEIHKGFATCNQGNGASSGEKRNGGWGPGLTAYSNGPVARMTPGEQMVREASDRLVIKKTAASVNKAIVASEAEERVRRRQKKRKKRRLPAKITINASSSSHSTVDFNYELNSTWSAARYS